MSSTGVPGVYSTVDVLTLGETMVGFRHDGPLSGGNTWQSYVAGSESNTAIGLARMGHRVAWLSRLGTDPLGDLVLREIRAEGVDTSLVTRDPQRPTGAMFAVSTAAGTRVDYHRAGSAASALSPADLTAVQHLQPRVVLVTGITAALSDSAADCVAEALAMFPSAWRVLVVNHRSRLWSSAQASARLRPLLGRVDMLISAADELEVVSDQTPQQAATELAAQGVVTVAITRGSHGAQLWTQNTGWLHAEALPVTVVDQVGAGDAFTAGVLSAILDELSPREALDRGVLLGAHTVSTRGDWEGAPTRGTLALAEADRTHR